MSATTPATIMMADLGVEDAGSSPTRGHCLDTRDPCHPFNLSSTRKRLIVIIGMICVFNGNLGSSLPSGATIPLATYFSIPPTSISIVLLNSLYMIGFTISPLFFAPLSETIGRRPVVIGTYTSYTICTLCCAVAPTYTALLVLRLLAGIFAAVPNAVVGGLYADIFADPKARGRAMALFMFVGAQGPLVGPLVSGFAAKSLGWRMAFWVGLIITAVGMPVVWMLPETYVPVLAAKIRGNIGDEKSERKVSIRKGLKKIGVLLLRPGTMMLKEPILLFSSLYLALVYALMYLFFQSYPIVYRGTYGLGQDIIGLAYIPIMLGVSVSFTIFHLFGAYHAQASRQNKPWTKTEELRRLPLACIGGPFIPAALLILGFTATPNIHPAIPMVFAGTLFGTGYLLIFLAMIIYLSDVYKRYAASAQAAASTLRSLAAVCLPFAAPSLYGNLGVKWAGVVLAIIAGIMAVIPFVFLMFRGRLRARSDFAG